MPCATDISLTFGQGEEGKTPRFRPGARGSPFRDMTGTLFGTGAFRLTA